MKTWLSRNRSSDEKYNIHFQNTKPALVSRACGLCHKKECGLSYEGEYFDKEFSVYAYQFHNMFPRETHLEPGECIEIEPIEIKPKGAKE